MKTYSVAVTDSARRNGDTGFRTGYVYGAFGVCKERGNWALTHLCSGFRMATRNTKREAHQLCLDLEPAADWNFTEDHLTGPEVKAIQKVLRAGQIGT